MKTLILGAACLALLGGCAALKSDYAALTSEQKTCLVVESATFASSVPGWGHMTYAQKATAVSAGIDAVALACSIDSAALAQARPLISAAIQAAALVE
jgi:hypothetical protein